VRFTEAEVTAAVERHDRQLRADNFIMMGIPEIANETNELTKEEVVKVLEEGMKLPAKTRGIVLEAVRIGKGNGKKPRPIKVRAAAGECREVLWRGVVARLGVPL
jgi:hypothetical protein